MKKFDKTNRPQPSQRLTLQRETIRHLEAPALARVCAGTIFVQTWPTFTKPDI